MIVRERPIAALTDISTAHFSRGRNSFSMLLLQLLMEGSAVRVYLIHLRKECMVATVAHLQIGMHLRILMRTVMEAVMAILGSGVRVGVLLQGKHVRDDNRTLVQTGIACQENLDSLGFTLELNSLEAPPDVFVGDPNPSTLCETSPGIRSLVIPISDSRVIDALRGSCLLTNMDNLVKTNQESSSPPTDIVADKVTPTSLALVPIPARSTEPLAVVPVSQKAQRSELVQRRTRRPFSVFEVEALVQAVEEVGTGRWRDVKLRAFENADHRTYVDLKDKWKTLVHTARISSQQRRGEPVPQ